VSGSTTEPVAKNGTAVRLKDMDPYRATQPNVRMADFAGQWSIHYPPEPTITNLPNRNRLFETIEGSEAIVPIP
jgi:hypothetical protein